MMNSKISKTKEKLIEVARELFALKGKKEVTMNDIAENSHKGRRTLYTYFRNKEDIYKAVINSELDNIIARLDNIANNERTVLSKLKEFIDTHLITMRELVNRNGTLHADFFNNIQEVELHRRKMDVKERKMIAKILSEGVRKGVFRNLDIEIVSIIILNALKGLEVPYIRGKIDYTFDGYDIILKGILR